MAVIIDRQTEMAGLWPRWIFDRILPCSKQFHNRQREFVEAGRIGKAAGDEKIRERFGCRFLRQIRPVTSGDLTYPIPAFRGAYYSLDDRPAVSFQKRGGANVGGYHESLN